MQAKAVLLDRDGVLNVDIPGGLHHIDDLRFESGIGPAIRKLNDAGYLILVITNQASVGRKELSAEHLLQIHKKMNEHLNKFDARIDDWFICPHTDEDHCECRKPKPGLILQAQKKYGLNLNKTWFLGDAFRDVEAARSSGCIPAFVGTGKGAKESTKHPEVPFFRDLGHFVSVLLQES